MSGRARPVQRGNHEPDLRLPHPVDFRKPFAITFAAPVSGSLHTLPAGTRFGSTRPALN